MKPGSITIRQRSSDSQNNGFFQANLLQRRQRRTHRPENSWLRFVGIRRKWSSWNFWRKNAQSRDSTTMNYWTDSIRNWKRHGPILESSRPNSMNRATNCCRIHRSSVWLSMASLCSPAWERSSRGKKSAQTRR